MTGPQDYTRRTGPAVCLLILVLIGIAFIPPCTVGGIRLRRANILPELFAFDDPASQTDGVPQLEEAFSVDLDQVARRIARSRSASARPGDDPASAATPAEEPSAIPRSDSAATDTLRAYDPFEWSLGGADDRLRPQTLSGDTTYYYPERIPIEDFDTTGESPLRRFYAKLADTTYSRRVRIAVLGDSFIEGDILTADLREALQSRYGGCGTGFAPMASPLTGYRRTIRTQWQGWRSYNIMQRRTAPADLRGDYFVSGWICKPDPGATVRWEGSDFRRRIDTCRRASLLFIARDSCRVVLTVNDTEERSFEIPPAECLRRIVVRGPIGSLALRLDSGAAGFTGYGAVFEGDGGVTVDNYSIRSNNGQALFGTDPVLNAQANALLGYDLIVLQYGLNILQSGVNDYTVYARQVEKMIAFVRQCFPEAAVLVLATSDRSVRSDNGFAPIGSAPALAGYQRRAARTAGAAFWNTYEAMRMLGGMERFVANGWAGKDYTHINYAGGSRIARALADALNEGVRREERRRIRLRHEARAVADSIKLAGFDERLRLNPVARIEIPNPVPQRH